MDLQLLKEVAVSAGKVGMRRSGRVERQVKPDRYLVILAEVEIEALPVARPNSHPRGLEAGPTE